MSETLTAPLPAATRADHRDVGNIARRREALPAEHMARHDHGARRGGSGGGDEITTIDLATGHERPWR